MRTQTLITQAKKLRKELRITTKVINLYNFDLDNGDLVSCQPTHQLIANSDQKNTQHIISRLFQLARQNRSYVLNRALHAREIIYGPDILPNLERHMRECLHKDYINKYLKDYHALRVLTRSHNEVWYLVDRDNAIRSKGDYFASIRPIKATDVSYAIGDFLEAEKDYV